ncbi:hypothetical protein WN55_08986 [Dufourea novaeangliae]|uniref:Reverse transcriptase domain-containing protein n=1 Tax=Dufourea novaeangliae TaxID=178035 RepID=A0A154P677_DUFNO|nr:hypothetical protein WN55_08986 [Dufourea novaeangliae]
MIEELKGYLRKKGLKLNLGKSKVMESFGKGGGTRKERKYWWGEGEVEEVRQYGYLGYRIQRNGKQEEQVRERERKAAGAMGWGLGKRGV